MNLIMFKCWKFSKQKFYTKNFENKFDWDHSKIDDVALGKIAHQENFNTYPVDSLHVDGKFTKRHIE